MISDAVGVAIASSVAAIVATVLGAFSQRGVRLDAREARLSAQLAAETSLNAAHAAGVAQDKADQAQVTAGVQREEQIEALGAVHRIVNSQRTEMLRQIEMLKTEVMRLQTPGASTPASTARANPEVTIDSGVVRMSEPAGAPSVADVAAQQPKP